MSANTTVTKVKALIAEAQIYAKLIASLLGGVLIIASTVIPADWSVYATIAIVIITSFSVWKFPNAEVTAVTE
jgi:hypothetical protein